jgi:hypothetical protein
MSTDLLDGGLLSNDAINMDDVQWNRQAPIFQGRSRRKLVGEGKHRS